MIKKIEKINPIAKSLRDNLYRKRVREAIDIYIEALEDSDYDGGSSVGSVVSNSLEQV